MAPPTRIAHEAPPIADQVCKDASGPAPVNGAEEKTLALEPATVPQDSPQQPKRLVEEIVFDFKPPLTSASQTIIAAPRPLQAQSPIALWSHHPLRPPSAS